MDDEKLSPRLAAIADALPLEPGMRVLEIGCGPGALARAIARRVSGGHVIAIDRSAKAVDLARRQAADLIKSGRLDVRCSPVETFCLSPAEPRCQIAVAVRVGVLDGRHPKQEQQALQRVAAALEPGGLLFIDGGDPLRIVSLPEIEPRHP